MKDISQNKKTPKNFRTLVPHPKKAQKNEKIRKQKEILQNESY